MESELGIVADEIEALKDFLQARLRSAVLQKPDGEADVQNAIELLFGRGLQKGIDYDRETSRVKVSTSRRWAAWHRPFPLVALLWIRKPYLLPMRIPPAFRGYGSRMNK